MSTLIMIVIGLILSWLKLDVFIYIAIEELFSTKISASTYWVIVVLLGLLGDLFRSSTSVTYKKE